MVIIKTINEYIHIKLSVFKAQ